MPDTTMRRVVRTAALVTAGLALPALFAWAQPGATLAPSGGIARTIGAGMTDDAPMGGGPPDRPWR